MSAEHRKTVILVDRTLPAGLAVNAASIASCMITSRFPELMGPPVKTSDAELPGVVLAPLPVLAATSDDLARVWQAVRQDGTGIEPFPFTKLAQGCRTYDEYVEKMAAAEVDQLELSALGLCGATKSVAALTGSLSLYRGK